MFKKVPIVFIVLAVLISLGVLFWQTGQEKEEGPKPSSLPIRVAKYNWPGVYWNEIAHKKGWFKEAGMNVQLIDTNTDYYGSLEDMMAGKMEVNGFYFFDFIRYRLDGAKLIAVLNQDISFGMDGIVAKKEIKTIQGLKGRAIGLSKNSYLEYLLNVVLERNGLTLDDLIIVDMPGEKTAAEFTNGSVDAIVTWEPFMTTAINKGDGHKLFDTSEMAGLIPGVAVFHKSFIEKRPEDVQAYVNVWHKTTRFIKENPKEAFGIIAKIYGKDLSEIQQLAEIDRIMGLRENVTAFSYGAGFESLHGVARQINNFMINKGLTETRFDSTKFLDQRFIRNLKNQIIADGM